MAQRYIATLSAYAQDYENSDRHQAALALYQAGLQMESGCEVFYQGVMRCELQLGRPMEAARAYDALTQVLSNQPDSRPSQVTEKIYEKVRQATQVQTRSQ